MSWDFVVADGPYGRFTEGPAWDGSGLLFTHVPPSRIMRYDPQTRVSSVFRSGTGWANGLAFDMEGRLYACEGGARRVVRYELDGGTTVLVDGFEGKRLNIPNDLAIDPQGRVWFTDPYYEGAGGPWSRDRANKDLDHDSVYRLDPQPDGTWTVARVTFDTTRPNGILFSLDFNTLYVAQTDPDADQKRQLWAYPVRGDRSLGQRTVLYDFGSYQGIDGMCLDTDGAIVACVQNLRPGGTTPMIYVFSPSGEVLETHPMTLGEPTNCAFGGPDLSTLYVTTGEGHLLEARTERRGWSLFPPRLTNAP